MGAPTDPIAAIRAGFFAECEDLLARLSDALSAPDFGEAEVHEAFRAVHTIKGGAASLGLSALAAFAHGFEGRLDRLRSGAPATAALIGDLVLAADQLADHVSAARDAAGAPPGWTVTFRPTAALYASGNDPIHMLTALAALGDITVRCDQSDLPPLAELDPEGACLGWIIDLPAPVPESAIRDCFEFVEDLCHLEISPRSPAPDQPRPAATAPDRPTVRVDLARVDRLMDLAGELVIGQSMLGRALQDRAADRHSPAMMALESLSGLTRDLQEAVMEIRAQPVKPLFQRMARTLREAAASLGKEAVLVTEGEATEVDRAVLERLAEPLTHMIRNAVGHGIEDPARRRALGKPATGRVTLSAAHRAGRVTIQLADDGAGIDRARVRAIAAARGLCDAPDRLSDNALDDLLFHPGFSTAAEVTDLSGRGVGLDAVRVAITALGGRVSLTSAPGLGCRFTLSLPLTLAVMDGLLVRVAGQTLVIPLAATLETAHLAALAPRRCGPDEPLVSLRGRHTPVREAAALLGLGSGPVTGTDRLAVLIADEDDRRLVLIVDDILDQAQVVIRNLSHNCGRVSGVAAATILGDGRVALILDPGDLVTLAGQDHPAPRHALQGAA